VRIQYKLCLLLHHSLQYLSQLLTPVYVIPLRSVLRSAINSDFDIPRSRRKISERAFSIAAPHTWNQLSTDLKNQQSTSSFKRHLNFLNCTCSMPPIVTAQSYYRCNSSLSTSRGRIIIEYLLICISGRYLHTLLTIAIGL